MKIFGLYLKVPYDGNLLEDQTRAWITFAGIRKLKKAEFVSFTLSTDFPEYARNYFRQDLYQFAEDGYYYISGTEVAGENNEIVEYSHFFVPLKRL